MRILFFTLLIIVSINLYSQKRTITGVIIDKYFESFPGARIMNSDSTFLGISDINGKFTIDIFPEKNWLLIAAVGAEWKSITIPINCNHLEVILLLSATYDFLPLKRVNRLRKKEFNQLPKLHKAAFQKGVFFSDKPCYEERFIPNKW